MIHFQHFNFNVLDLDKSLTFYKNALDLEVVREYETLLDRVGADETPAFLMPTYTAMFDLRNEISRHTDIKAFYE